MPAPGRTPVAVEAVPVAPVVAGGTGELSVVVREPAEPDLDLTVWLWSSRVELLENRLGWDHVVDPAAEQPRLRVTFEAPREPGTYRVEGHIAFASCGPRACWERHADLAWSVEVGAPPD